MRKLLFFLLAASLGILGLGLGATTLGDKAQPLLREPRPCKPWIMVQKKKKERKKENKTNR